MGKRVDRIRNNLKPLVDTHAIYWYFFDRQKLSSKVVNILKSQKFIVSTIILAELVNLLERKGISALETKKIWRFLGNKNIKIVAFDIKILREFLQQNRNLSIHDRIIVATAKICKTPIVTKDKIISQYYPKTIW